METKLITYPTKVKVISSPNKLQFEQELELFNEEFGGFVHVPNGTQFHTCVTPGGAMFYTMVYIYTPFKQLRSKFRFCADELCEVEFKDYDTILCPKHEQEEVLNN